MLLLQCFLQSLSYAYPEHAIVPLIFLVQVTVCDFNGFCQTIYYFFLMTKKNFIEKDYFMQDEWSTIKICTRKKSRKTICYVFF